MRKPILAFAAVALALAGRAANAAEAQRGKAVFDHWCSGCHDPAGGRDHAGTYILGLKYKGAVPAALEQRTDLTAAYVKTIVRTGRSFMPRTRKTEISDAELDDLAAYLSKSGN